MFSSEQILANVAKMEDGMPEHNPNAKLTGPEIVYALSGYTLSEPASRTFCEMLEISKSHAFAGVSIPAALELVKKYAGTTKGLVATAQECKQAVRILGIRIGLAHQAFEGRPLRQLIEISRWLLTNRHKDDFDVPEVLGQWALDQERKEEAANIEARAMDMYKGLREME